MENLDKPIAIDKIFRKIMRFDVEKASKWKWLHNWILSNLLDTDNYNVIQILATQCGPWTSTASLGSLLEMQKLRSPPRPTKLDSEFSQALSVICVCMNF